MAKVVYVPLDERPCNFQYPKALADMTDMEMVLPDSNILGKMKLPANVPLLINWLKEETKTADYLIVSIDMLIYGGIVPSRLHELTVQECLERLSILRVIKKQNPSIEIYAYNLIMRVPNYDSSEEEPDYYEQHGRKIFRLGWLTDKKEQKIFSKEEEEELASVERELPKEIEADYLGRRKKNFSVTAEVVNMVDNSEIDYLIIPLDDNSKYGFTAKEQRQFMYQIDRLNLMDKVNIYPGADEIACTLFARVFCQANQYTPELAVRYSSTNGPFIIPKYEDRSLSESIKAHITSAGGVIVNDERENDLILMVHSPAVGQHEMSESSFALETRHRSYFSEVNIREFVQAMKHFVRKGRNVALADVAICNGADLSLMQLVNKEGLLSVLIAYAAWNTNGNTMGTVISHAIIASYYKKQEGGGDHEKNSRKFFYTRLVEDWGYQAVVRKRVSYEILPTMDLTPRNLEDQVSEVTYLVARLLGNFVDTNLSGLKEGKIELKDVRLPWNRMFEVGFNLEMNEKVSNSK